MAFETRWNPERYLRFADHRLRPALDLMAQISRDAPRVVVDLGCGAGNVTRLLADRWATAKVQGVDSSPEMLARAASAPSAVRWVERRIEDWTPEEPPDLIFSNAALHWVEEHATLFPRLVGTLRDGGCLAVQLPLSWGTPSHRLIEATLLDGGDAGRPLGTETLRRTVGRKWVEDASVYYDLLAGRTRHLDIWTTEYLHELEGENPVLEWVRGTALRPVLTELADEERARFLAAYGRRLRDAYPPAANGRTLFPFRRLFIVART